MSATNVKIKRLEELSNELEHKLEETENNYIHLKDREADLLSQINTLRCENIDLRLKGERATLSNQNAFWSSVQKRETINLSPSSRTNLKVNNGFSQMNYNPRLTANIEKNQQLEPVGDLSEAKSQISGLKTEKA